MWVQKSFEEDRGKLYVVGTPIGNLEDLSDRVKVIFQEVDMIAAEDTRYSRKLLNHLQISTPLISYHEHNEHQRGEELIQRLLRGEKIALISDAGLPAISDPGNILVKLAIDHEIPVIPVPGPNAALSALICSGLPTQPFLFFGFMPRDKKRRKQVMEQWKDFRETVIFYESPHRLEKVLREMLTIWGDRQICLARELTKKHEEFLRGTISEMIPYLEKHGVRGEYTLIVKGSEREKPLAKSDWWKSLTEIAHVEHYLDRGLSKKEAILQAAKDRGVPKREIYQLYHNSK